MSGTELGKAFCFNADLQQAYKSPEGKMHVVAVASDDDEDRTGDRMSTKAIKSMAAQATRDKLPLLDNHKGTFGFGETHSATTRRVKDAKGRMTTQFVVDFELDEDYPQARSLFREVQNGGSQKQLSIGGFLNMKNKKAVSFEENSDGKIVRVINDILLEHIAATRPNMAAVPRTRFMDAIVKDIFGSDDELPVEWQQTAAEKIAEQVAAGHTSGSLEIQTTTSVPPTIVTYDVAAHRSEAAANKREVIVVMIKQDDQQADEKASPPMTTQATDTSKEAASAEAQKEQAMSAEAQTEAAATAAPAVTKEAADPEVTKGLDVLRSIGKSFSATAEAAPQKAAELENLEKAWDVFRTSAVAEKSADAVRRIMQSMGRLLDEEVGAERAATDSSFALKSDDIDKIAAAVAKNLQTGEGAVDDGTKISNEDVQKTFTTAFGGLTTELAKGLTEMAGGFQTLVEKQIGEVVDQIKATEKSADERLEKLEKVAGVRQSAPGQDAAVATGQNPTSAAPATAAAPQTQTQVIKARRPDTTNPFRGMFDKSRRDYLASHR